MTSNPVAATGEPLAPVLLRLPPALRWGAGLLGVALSGFFDGILLHQLLQWHHLLSGVNDPAFAPIERQILADGLFHGLMYVLAAVALWLLWRGRAALGAQHVARRVAGHLLLGFGAWNLLDIGVFHWLLGLHRVRMDSPRPMLWDVLWLLAFGLLPMALGLWLGRRRDGDADGSGPRQAGAAAWATIAAGAGLLALWAAWPPANAPTLLVLYPAGTPGATVLRGVDAVDGRILWVNAGGTLWALDVPPRSDIAPLHRHGAWLTSRSAAWAACSRWARSGASAASAAAERPL